MVRGKTALHVVATGSSALDPETGTRETTAGRFEKTSLRHWGAGALVELLGVRRKEAPGNLVTRGGYPGARVFWKDEGRLRSYLRDAIVEPAIGRDILRLEQVRKPALLRQIFALAMAHPAEILSLEKIAGSLAGKGALETIARYLHLLQEAYLVAPVSKWSGGEIRRRKSAPKLIALNNGLLLGGSSLPAPDPQNEPARWGRWIVEVKTGRYSMADLKGLAVASTKFPDFSPVVLCDPGEEGPAEAAGFHAVSWHDYLLRGLAGG